MDRTVILRVVSGSIDSERVASFTERYSGAGSNHLKCGRCGFEVATGVDPYLYPSMFGGASYIRCPRCQTINALPLGL